MVLSARLVAIAILAAGCDSTPETPANAVMEFITAAQVSDTGDAGARLCDRLRNADGDAEALARINHVVHDASVFGREEVTQKGDTAVVMLDVVFSPAPPGAKGDLWAAELVRENGRWKVCGFRPANADPPSR